MRALAVNGNPRKTWNTATLLEQAMSGCATDGADIEMVHLAAKVVAGPQARRYSARLPSARLR